VGPDHKTWTNVGRALAWRAVGCRGGRCRDLFLTDVVPPDDRWSAIGNPDLARIVRKIANCTTSTAGQLPAWFTALAAWTVYFLISGRRESRGLGLLPCIKYRRELWRLAEHFETFVVVEMSAKTRSSAGGRHDEFLAKRRRYHDIRPSVGRAVVELTTFRVFSLPRRGSAHVFLPTSARTT